MWQERYGLYCQPGNQGMLVKQSLGAEADGYLKIWMSDAPPFDWAWERTHVLRFMRPGDAHTVELFWGIDWAFLGWYVNLQAPLTIDGSRFDTMDWALDIVVDPDGTWQWKDEHHLAEALALGIFDPESAAEVRTEGERVIAARPWPTGWEDWRPPNHWTPLPLPHSWEVVS